MFSSESAVEDSDPPSSTSRHDPFGERFLFDEKLASFGERFAGADISVAETEEDASNVLNYALAIAGSGGARNSPTCGRPIRAEACTGRFITTRERPKKKGCDRGAIEPFDLTGRQ